MKFKAQKVVVGKHTGRILLQIELSVGMCRILAATPEKPMEYYPSLERLDGANYGNSKEIDLLKEKWIHPHLPKSVKDVVYDLLKSQ